jgi:hypothetical protein
MSGVLQEPGQVGAEGGLAAYERQLLAPFCAETFQDATRVGFTNAAAGAL